MVVKIEKVKVNEEEIASLMPSIYRKLEWLDKEDIIKRQFNCKATGFWVKKSQESNFLLIMHEHLFVFRKLSKDESKTIFKDSMSNNDLRQNGN